MKVYSIPPTLWASSLGVLLFIPAIWAQQHYFLFMGSSRILHEIFSVLILLCWMRLFRLKKDVPYFVLSLSFLWALGSLVHAAWNAIFWEAVIALGISLWGGLCFFWTRYELSRPYIEGGLKWFMGRPDPIPGLQARVKGSDAVFSISAIDRKGVFLSSVEAEIPFQLKPLEIEIQYRNRRSFKAKASPVLSSRENRAAGVRFLPLDWVNLKEAGDMMEELKGTGYDV